MSAITTGHEQVTTGASQKAARGLSGQPVRDGIHKPAHPHLRVHAGFVLLISSPLSVALTMLFGWLFMSVLALPLHAGEMVGAAIVAIVGGIVSALPLINAMQTNQADTMAKSALSGIGIRVVVLLAGAWLAMGKNWGLGAEPLAFWLLGFYFPMLVAETGVMAWILKQQDPS